VLLIAESLNRLKWQVVNNSDEYLDSIKKGLFLSLV
jgi:hypothetical protein